MKLVRVDGYGKGGIVSFPLTTYGTAMMMRIADLWRLTQTFPQFQIRHIAQPTAQVTVTTTLRYIGE